MIQFQSFLSTKLTRFAVWGVLLFLGLGVFSTAGAWQIPPQKVEAALNTHIKKAINLQPGAMLSVEMMNPSLMLPVYPDSVRPEEIQIRIESPLTTMYSNRSIIQLTFEGPQGQISILRVPVELHIEKSVWVVQSTISAGHHLNGGDVKLETRDVSMTYEHAVGSELSPNLYEARVNLRPGDVLDKRKINLPPDVRRNEEVRITLSNGQGLAISVVGMAMQDGRIGDTIKVKHQRDKTRYYTATVTNKNQVLVEI